MALTLKVENTTDGIVGRAGHRFDAGETKEIKIDSTRLHEIQDCPYFNLEVVSADYMGEIPEGMKFSANATDEAIDLARANGVDVFSVKGSGSGDRVTKKDVQRHMAEASANAGPGEGVVSTLSSIEDQKRAEAESLQRIVEAEQRVHPHEVDSGGDSLADQTSHTDESEKDAGDVEQAQSSQDSADGEHRADAARGR